MPKALLIAGFAFLFNPCIGTLDVLPDAVGCLLIVTALTKAAFISPDLEDARENFKKLAYVSLAEIILMIISISIRDGDSAISLALTSVSVILKLVFLIISHKSLFTGVRFLNERYSASETINEDAVNARIMSYVFFIARAVLTVLPELGYLKTDEEQLISGKTFFFAAYRTQLSAANIFLITVLGAVWLYFVIKLICDIFRDEKLYGNLKDAYVKADPGMEYWFGRKLRLAYTFLGTASLLYINIYVDGSSFTPDFLSALMIFFTVIAFASAVKKRSDDTMNVDFRVPYAASVVFFASSTVSWVSSVLFSGDYYKANEMIMIPEMLTFGRAGTLRRLTVISQIIASAAFAVTFLFTAYFSYRTVGGYLRSRHINDLSSEYDKKRKARQKLYTKIYLCSAFALISCIAKVLYHVFLFSFPEFWMIDFAVCVIFAVLMLSLCSDMKFNIDLK